MHSRLRRGVQGLSAATTTRTSKVLISEMKSKHCRSGKSVPDSGELRNPSLRSTVYAHTDAYFTLDPDSAQIALVQMTGRGGQTKSTRS
jgi:hypothetical protein